MSRRYKGPHLWFRKDRNSWFILDRGKQIGTGCPKENRYGAESALLRYVEGLPEDRTYYVYFITADFPGFPIKIGISEIHNMRFSALQTAIPYEIKVLAVLPTENAILERQIHRKFEHIRMRGEWFQSTPELLDYITYLVDGKQAA